MNHNTTNLSGLIEKTRRHVLAGLPSKPKLMLAATIAGLTLTAGVAQAGLVNEWRGDDYAGGNWVDHIGSVAAAATGTPLAVPATFNTHAGVNVNGGYFSIPAGTAPAGSSNFTVVVVIKPEVPGPSYTGYWDAAPLIAFDIGGGGQTDWGISWGGGNGTRIVDGVGVQNVAGASGDVQASTADLAMNSVHALALQANADAGTVVTYVDGVVVQSNKVITINPRSSANVAFVGGGMGKGIFAGQYAAIQVYNDAAVDCVALTQTLLTTYATPPAITLPYATGAVPGQNAAVTIGIPVSASASSPFTVTLTSDNPTVVANSSATFPKGTISQTVNLPILAVGVARVTATGTGVASAVVRLAGLDESALANRWLADTFNDGDPVWTDSKGSVAATASGSPLAIPAAFGTAHKGVTRNGGSFAIPSGTAPGGIATFTVAVVIKPTAIGNTGGNYYNGKYIIGYDIGGGGQADWGLSWGGGAPATGQRILAGIGRSGGDSGLNSGVGPLALNQAHGVVMQVNSATGVQTLWVDGTLRQYNGGLTMINMDTRDIPLLNDYDGLCAEVRIYNGASVDGAALSGMLQSTYAGAPPIGLVGVAPTFVDPPGSATVTVTVPASATLSSSYTVTLMSDNLAVANSTSVTLLTGVTSTNVNLPILSIGVANIVASGTGLSESVPVRIGGLSPRVLAEAFRASTPNSINGATPNNGDPVYFWTGDTNPATVATPGTLNPTYKANATLAGTPSVVFINNSILTIVGDLGINPVSGRTNFSVVLVYKGIGTGASGSFWYQQSGIANAESGGVVDDWGCTLDGVGQFNAGLGNPDVTMPQLGYNTSDSLFHAAVAAYDVLNGEMRVNVDNKPTTVSTTPISIDPRGNYETRLGDNNFNGEIAEIRFYDGALTGAEATNVIDSLKAAYKLMWPDQSLCSITSSLSGGMAGDDIPLTVSIPQGFNAVSAVSVQVVNSNPSAVTLPGGTPITLTFAAGATNVQTITAHLAATGSSTITVSSPGLLAGTKTLTVLAPATLVEAFRAYSLTNQFPGIANGDPVASWAGDIHPATAIMGQNSTIVPTFIAKATPSGLPSVAFDAANSTAFVIPGAGTPVGGLNNFSFAVVFKEAAAGSGDGQWYNMPAIIDAEEPGAQNDWGIAFDANGQLNFGVGNTDYTLLDPHNLVSATDYHVAIMTSYPLQNQMTITVDGYPTTTTPVGANIGPAPRNMANVYIGRSFASKFFTGELVEWDVYNGILTSSEIATLSSSLRSKYGILSATDLVLGIAPTTGNAIKLSWPAVATSGGYVLESSTSVTGGWAAAGLTVTTEGSLSVATDTIGGAAKFYRLHRP